jgi:hypothetical protein
MGRPAAPAVRPSARDRRRAGGKPAGLDHQVDDRPTIHRRQVGSISRRQGWRVFGRPEGFPLRPFTNQPLPVLPCQFSLREFPATACRRLIIPDPPTSGNLVNDKKITVYRSRVRVDQMCRRASCGARCGCPREMSEQQQIISGFLIAAPFVDKSTAHSFQCHRWKQ